MDLLELPQARPVSDRDVPKMVHYWCSRCEKTCCSSTVQHSIHPDKPVDCLVCIEMWPDDAECPRCGGNG